MKSTIVCLSFLLLLQSCNTEQKRDETTETGSSEDSASSPATPEENSDETPTVEWGYANAEDRHVRDLLANALRSSDSSSLEKPNLVSVAYHEQRGKPVIFHWIASPPGADGLRMFMRSGGSQTVRINQSFLDENLESQKGEDADDVCHAELLLDATGLIKIAPSEYVSAQLTLKGKPVSNVCDFRDAIISPEEANILAVVREHVECVANEDLDGFKDTLHSESDHYEETITALRDMYKEIDISVDLYWSRVLNVEEGIAQVYFGQAVRRVSGSPMQNHEIEGIYTLKKDKGKWKFFSTNGEVTKNI